MDLVMNITNFILGWIFMVSLIGVFFGAFATGYFLVHRDQWVSLRRYASRRLTDYERRRSDGS